MSRVGVAGVFDIKCIIDVVYCFAFTHRTVSLSEDNPAMLMSDDGDDYESMRGWRPSRIN